MKGALRSFDIPDGVYEDDVLPIRDSCIERYGLREWRAAVLTNEIHGHLGVYSTLGAKMGVRALEEFEAMGLDTSHISALSYAGSVPPLSCLNDGVQVSTGATVGHGALALADSAELCPKVVFSCGGKSLTLTLRPEYENVIRADISEALRLYSHTPAYWARVRQLALRYWASWDRKEIFSCESA